MSKSNLTRRDFLKLSGYGLMAMLLPDLSSYFPQQDDFENLQARVIDRILWAHDEPNVGAKRAKLYWHDLILPITNTTISDDEAAYNRVWYQVEDGGYIYSGSIQPVRTILISHSKFHPGVRWERAACLSPKHVSNQMAAPNLFIASIMKLSIG